jgi:hypothetical protein
MTHTLALAMTDKSSITTQEIADLIVREILDRDDGEDVVMGLLAAYLAMVERGDNERTIYLVPFEEAEETFFSEYKAAYKAETGREIKDGYGFGGLGWWPEQMGRETWPLHLVKRIARLSAAKDINEARSLIKAYKDDVNK